MADQNPVDSSEQASAESGSNKPRIGLCLSGGGFRASFFHLGTIRYLEEAGIMEKVEVISTVSGGSIIGAYYLVEMERKLRAQPNLDRLAACDQIIQEFSLTVHKNLRMRALVFYPFFHPLLTILKILRLRHFGDTMAKEFEKRFFSPRLRLGDLPVQSRSGLRGPRILINTTSMVSGLRVVFSRESDTGLVAQIEKSDPNEIPLARVVGASASVPGLFKPLHIANEVLADGGVVDNQGLESLFDYFEVSEERMNLLPRAFRQLPAVKALNRPISLIVSDAAGQFSIQAVKKATRSGSAARSMAILQASNRRKILKLLLEKSRQGIDFAFTHLSLNLKSEAGSPEERLPSELIVPTSQIRTDLDEFSLIEREVLIYHGYTLMKGRVSTCCPGLLPAASTVSKKSEKWPPRFVALVDPSGNNSQRARESRKRLGAFLDVSSSQFFRDVQRFPWCFGGILFVFAALGWSLSHVLLATPLPLIGISAKDLLRDRIIDIIASVIPAYDLGLINLEFLENAFSVTKGEFVGAIELSSTIVCVAFSFYLALFAYWGTKLLLLLPERREEQMLVRLEAIKESKSD